MWNSSLEDGFHWQTLDFLLLQDPLIVAGSKVKVTEAKMLFYSLQEAK